MGAGCGRFEAALTHTEEEAERELAKLTADQRKKLQQSSEKSAEANREVDRHKQEVAQLCSATPGVGRKTAHLFQDCPGASSIALQFPKYSSGTP